MKPTFNAADMARETRTAGATLDCRLLPEGHGEP